MAIGVIGLVLRSRLVGDVSLRDDEIDRENRTLHDLGFVP